MSTSLCTASLGLITAIILSLVAYGVTAEHRSASSTLTGPRKPPFNGSIFGKRNVWSSMPSLAESGTAYSSGNPLAYEDAASLLSESLINSVEQDAVNRATINYCLNLQPTLVEQDPDLALCATLLSALNQKVYGIRRSLGANDWFNQLITAN